MLQGKLATTLGIVHTKDLSPLHGIPDFSRKRPWNVFLYLSYGYERYGETQKVRPKVTDTMKLSGCLECHKFPSSTNRFHTYIAPKTLSSLNEAMSMLAFFLHVPGWNNEVKKKGSSLFSPAAIQQHSRQHPKCSIYLGKKHRKKAQTQQPPWFGQCWISLC